MDNYSWITQAREVYSRISCFNCWHSFPEAIVYAENREVAISCRLNPEQHEIVWPWGCCKDFQERNAAKAEGEGVY